MILTKEYTNMSTEKDMLVNDKEMLSLLMNIRGLFCDIKDLQTVLRIVLKEANHYEGFVSTQVIKKLERDTHRIGERAVDIHKNMHTI